MRLLHVTPSYLPAIRYGGPIFAVHGLCRALAAAGHEVHVATTSVDGDRDADVPHDREVPIDGVRVHYFRSRVLRKTYWSGDMALHLRTVAREFDLIHAHSAFLSPTALAAHGARRCGRPYVISPRGMLVASLIRRKSRLLKTAWIEAFERRNLRQAAAIHVTSPLESVELASLGLAYGSVICVPNGIDAPEDGAQPQRGRELRRVLFIGRINWKKGLDRLVQAMVHVPNAELVIAGNDEDRYSAHLLALIERGSVQGRVRLSGPVYGAEKWSLLRTADVFVLPSYSENFGNAALEALAVGVPVIVSPEVGLAETIAASSAGIVVSGDPQELGRAIGSLLDNAEKRRELGEAGARLVRARFGWHAIAATMAKHYAEILAKWRPRS